jgi:Ca2+-binding RTX toxin-like protein
MFTRSWTSRLFARKPRTARPVTRPAHRPHPARPLLERLEDRLAPTVNVYNNYGGLVGAAAPDTCGAAGPDTYIETVNHSVSVYDKGTGNALLSTDMFSFFFNVGGIAFETLADATSCYDEPIGRFIVADLQVSGSGAAPSYLDLCVSTSSNPHTLTAFDWHFYQIATTEGNLWSDYPGNLGYNHDALVDTFNMFDSTTGYFAHSEIDALSQSDLAAHGSSVHYNQFDLGGANYRPVTMHDAVAGGPMWFVQDSGFGGGGSSINLVRSDNILGSTAVQTFNVGVATYYSPTDPLNPDGTSILDSNHPPDTRIFKAAEANNLIVACHNIQVNYNENDARWYEFNVSNINSPTLVDQGNVGFGANTYTMYPGIDINAAGDIAMSVDRSGTDTATDYLSVYVTGRTAADGASAPGQMDTPVLVRAGDSNDHQGRQGDFSGINVDPQDGTSFWIANEFCSSGSSGTEITHFKMTDTGQAYISNGVLEVVGSNAADNVTLQPTPGDASQTQVVNNGTVVGSFANSSFSSINVNLLAGDDHLNLLDTGGSSGLAFFGVPVTVDGGTGLNTLGLDDHTSSSANFYTVTSNTLSRSGGFGGVTFANLGDVILADGSAINSINVLSTSANLDLYAVGQDSVYIGSNGSAGGGTVQGIQGVVTVAPAGGTASLTVDDSGDSTGRTVTLTNTLVLGTVFMGRIIGLAPAPIQWFPKFPTSTSSGEVTDLTVFGGSGGNTFNVMGTSNFSQYTGLDTGTGTNTVNVEATTGTLTVFTQGHDSIYVGSNGSALGGNVQGIQGRVQVSGGGAATLTVDDGGDTTSRAATLSNTPSLFVGAITGLAPALIEWVPTSSVTGGVTGLTVYGGSGGNTFTVAGTSNFYASTTLSSGAGNDTVNVENTTGALYVSNPGGNDTVWIGSNPSAFGGDVQGINGPVDVYGPGGTILIVDDSGDSNGRTATQSDGALTGLAPATISWTPTSSATGGVIGLNVFGGSGGSTFDVAGTSNFYAYDYLQTGTGNDAVNITATTGSLTVYNTGGTDSVVVGSLAPATTGGTLAAVNGFVGVSGLGATNLTVDDSGDTTARSALVTSSAVTGLGNPAPIEYASGVSALTVNGSQGASTYTIQSTQAGTATVVNGGPANDTFQVGDATHPLSGIQGNLTLNGGGGTNLVTLTDTAQSAGEYYYLGSNWFTGAMAGVSFTGMKGLTFNAGSGTVGLVVKAVPTAVPVTFKGGGGTDGLFGPNDNNTWAITGNNAGKLTAATVTGTTLGTVSFSRVQYLFGGSVADLFKLTPGKLLSGYIQGGSGIETLDYSQWKVSVTVNLGTHAATHIAQGVNGVENINGGLGNDSLTGDSLNNIIRGGGGADTILGGGGNDILIGGQGAASLSAAGSGRSMLIGGKSSVPQTLTGSAQDDLFIGGYTNYDSYSLAHDQALLALLAEWTSGDSEATRESKISHGVGPGGRYKFKLGGTVFGDGASDTINGNGAEPGDTDWVINL